MDVGSKPLATTAIALVTIACVAFFLARGTGALVARAAFGSSVPLAGPSDSTEPEPHQVADADAILRRNIFDSAGGSLSGPVAPPDPPGDDRVSRCDEGSRLVATFFDGARPEGSIAAILDGSGVSRLYRVGQQVGAHSLVGIGGQSVRLENDEGSCQLRMFGGEPEPRAEPERASADGIAALSEDRYRISRSMVREAIASPESLGSARVVMSSRGGRREPRLYGVREGSVLARIGLRNGDVLKTVGEHDLGDPDGILAAYGELERARRLTLTVERDGATRTLEYAFAP